MLAGSDKAILDEKVLETSNQTNKEESSAAPVEKAKPQIKHPLDLKKKYVNTVWSNTISQIMTTGKEREKV